MEDLDATLVEIAIEAAAAGKTEAEFMRGWPVLRLAMTDRSEESLNDVLARVSQSSDWPWQPEPDDY